MILVLTLDRGKLGWLRSLKVIGNVTIRYRSYDFLFAFHRNYLVPFSRYSKLFIENPKLFTPNVHLAPQLQLTPL